MAVDPKQVNALVVLATIFATIALITPGWVVGSESSKSTGFEVPIYLGFSFGDHSVSYATSIITTFTVILGCCYAAASHTDTHVKVYGSLGTELLVPFLMSCFLISVVIMWPITIGGVIGKNDYVTIQPGYSYVLAVFSMLFSFLAVGVHIKQHKEEMRPARRTRSLSRSPSPSPKPTRTTRVERPKSESRPETRPEVTREDSMEEV